MAECDMRRVVYPGTFDPLTNGHINIIQRALTIFDQVIIAIARESTKKTLFSLDERLQLIEKIFHAHPGVAVEAFDGLLVHYLQKKGIKTVIRGLRTYSDFEFELQMALANKALDNEIETCFLATEGRYSHLSSTILKEIIRVGGENIDMVPPEIELALKQKFATQKISN